MPPIVQVPDEIRVPRNLSITFSDNGFLTSSIAFVEYFKNVRWECNIEDIEPSKLKETKLYFSHFQGVNLGGDYTRVVDFIEFYDPRANGGITLKSDSYFPFLVMLSFFALKIVIV